MGDIVDELFRGGISERVLCLYVGCWRGRQQRRNMGWYGDIVDKLRVVCNTFELS